MDAQLGMKTAHVIHEAVRPSVPAQGGVYDASDELVQCGVAAGDEQHEPVVTAAGAVVAPLVALDLLLDDEREADDGGVIEVDVYFGIPFSARRSNFSTAA